MVLLKQYLKCDTCRCRFLMNGNSRSSPNSELIYELRASQSMVDKACQTGRGLALDETATFATAAEARPPVQELNHNISPPRRNIALRHTVEEEEAIENADEHLESVQPQAKTSTGNLEEMTEGSVDKVDGVWMPTESRQEEDGCGVRCLYIAVQCCECTIL